MFKHLLSESLIIDRVAGGPHCTGTALSSPGDLRNHVHLHIGGAGGATLTAQVAGFLNWK